MPLRKKHVRRLVFALLFVFVLGPLAALLFYGLWLRSGGLDARLERELASRLHCKALVRGARPTGLRTALAEEVRLLWQAGDGRLAVLLEHPWAETNAFGWSVRAARGSVTLAGPEPMALLAAVNQRLVQSESAPPLVSLVVERLSADLDLGPAQLSGEALVVAMGDAKALHLTFVPADAFAAENALAAVRETLLAPRWKTDLLVRPASDRGVFGGLKVDAKKIPAAQIQKLLGRAKDDAGPAAGTFDVAVAWRWPQADPCAAAVTVRAEGLDLADWTADLAGGKVTGKAALSVAYRHSGDERGRLQWHLESDGGGMIDAETLRLLEASVPAVRGFGDLFTGHIGYDRLRARFHTLADGRASLAEGDEETPLVSTTLFGEEVPLLWATPEPFDGGAAWKRLRSADESP